MEEQAAGGRPATAEDVNALLAAFEERVAGYKKRIDALEEHKNKSFWQRMSGRQRL